MDWVRRGLVGALGVVLIVDAVAAGRLPILQFVVGLIMVGLIPADYVVDIILRSRRDDGDEATIARLEEVMRRHDPPPDA